MKQERAILYKFFQHSSFHNKMTRKTEKYYEMQGLFF